MKFIRKIRIAAVMAVIAAVVLPLAAFALSDEEAGAVYTNFTGRVTMINDREPYPNIIRVEGEDEGDVFDFITTENTFYMTVNGIVPANDVGIALGDEVSVYFIQPLVQTLIYPPQREASVFVKVPESDEARSIFVGRFNRALVSDDNSLRLNISDDTVILRQNGESGKDVDLGGRDLAVVYSISTRSIPALTTPELIVILNPTPEMSEQMMAGQPAQQPAHRDEEAAEPTDFEVGGPLQLSPEDIAMLNTQLEEGLRGAQITVHGNVIDAPEHIVRDHLVFLPLRAIAEALGFDVFWEAETASVALGNAIRVQVGSYEYLVGRAAPITLHSAPFIANNTTYVPMEFFSEVLGYDAGYMIEDNRGEIIISERPEAQSAILSEEADDVDELTSTPVQTVTEHGNAE